MGYVEQAKELGEANLTIKFTACDTTEQVRHWGHGKYCA